MQPAAPIIHAEIIFYLRDWDRETGEQKTRTFRQAAYKFQSCGDTLVFMIEETIENHCFFFHWEDIDHVETVPSKIDTPKLVS